MSTPREQEQQSDLGETEKSVAALPNQPQEPEPSRDASVCETEAVAPTVSLRQVFMMQVAAELDRAYAKHGREQWGRHEFYAILLEEVDELWDDIKADAPQHQLAKEMVQIAAMCFRYFETGDRYRAPSAPRETPT